MSGTNKTIYIAAGVTDPGFGSHNVAVFVSTTGTLVVATGDSAGGLIGFAAQDALDFSGAHYTAGNTITVDAAGNFSGYSIQFRLGDAGLTTADFVLSSDGNGGTLVKPAAGAGILTWTSGGGTWSNAAGWSGGAAPTAVDSATIAEPAASVFTLTVDSAVARTVTLDAAGADLAVAGSLAVGGTLDNEAGTLALGTGAALSAVFVRQAAGTTLRLGQGARLELSGAVDEYYPGNPALELDGNATLTGATIDSAGSVLLGVVGAGTVLATDANVTAQLTELDTTLTIDGGQWSDSGAGAGESGDMVFGSAGGTLDLRGGAVLTEARDVLLGEGSALVSDGATWQVHGNLSEESFSPNTFVTIGGGAGGAGHLVVGGTLSNVSGMAISGGTVTAAAAAGLSVQMTGGSLAIAGLLDGTGVLTQGAVITAGTLQTVDFTLDATSRLQIGRGVASAGEVLIGAGATGTVETQMTAPAIDVAGTLVIEQSFDRFYATTLDGALIGTGVIAARTNLDLTTAAPFTNTIALASGATLKLDHAGAYSGTVDAAWIAGGAGGDTAVVTVDLLDVPLATANLTWDPAVGVASLGTLAPFGIAAPGETAASVSWSIGTDPSGGTLLTYRANSVACFASGTRIATPRGAASVEALRPGDMVLARTGDAWLPQPVRWVGAFTVDLSRHPHPEAAMPVLIRPGALGDGLPARDLLVSPDHALLIGAALMPAQVLVNGATILRVRGCRRITYHHIELERHALLLAEGVAAESYLDTGNRGQFDQEAGVRPLFPVLTARGGAKLRCARLALSGRRVAAAHRRLAARAGALGWSIDANSWPHVLADGTPLPLARHAELTWRTRVPVGTREIRLISRSFVPRERDPHAADLRLLGMAVVSLQLDGAELPPACCGHGWHAPEAGWRWTNGDARVAAGCGILTLTCAAAGPGYWIETLPAARAATVG